MSQPREASPIAAGALLAVLAAICFGATAPIIASAGRGVGPLATAALLYAGAAIGASLMRLAGRPAGSPLRRSDGPRLALVALLGAAVAPTLLAWGLQHSGGTIGSLLLNLEAVFTVLLARLFYREALGRRVLLAVGAMAIGGALLTLDAATAVGASLLGALAVAAATLGWALDNTLTRPLAERDPLDVILTKAGAGAALTTTLAFARGEPWPAAAMAVALLACGATGYGLSLRLYLVAQRRIGAARTGSIFAVAPFAGALLAYAAGDRAAGPLAGAAAMLFALGVTLHVTERHGHPHAHDALDHDHPHRHDDGHHDHVHVPPATGEHSHPHHHETLEHDHAHAPDLHHEHRHG